MSGELRSIIFYDITSITPGRPWSPNTLKTRYCLGYKQLPFTTVWVELPDIAELLQSKGITQPPYTLPAIEDPNTGAFIVDSFAIAAYLDETYPETPAVLSPAARAALQRIDDLFSFGSGPLTSKDPNTVMSSERARILVPRLAFLILASDRLNPVSRAYYHRTREARIGEPWRELADACAAGADPEARAACVVRGIESITVVCRDVTTAVYGGTALEKGETSTTFALGETPCFLDFAIAGRVKFALDSLAPLEAAMLQSLGGERLAKLVEDLEIYL